MRISDWSSDVCSSDLRAPSTGSGQGLQCDGGGGVRIPLVVPVGIVAAAIALSIFMYLRARSFCDNRVDILLRYCGWVAACFAAFCAFFWFFAYGDRKSVVYGKGVSVRVDLGGA